MGSADQSSCWFWRKICPSYWHQPEEGELSLRQGTGEGLGGQGLTICVKTESGCIDFAVGVW